MLLSTIGARKQFEASSAQRLKAGILNRKNPLINEVEVHINPCLDGSGRKAKSRGEVRIFRPCG